jgi:hypothetical protein
MRRGLGRVLIWLQFRLCFPDQPQDHLPLGWLSLDLQQPPKVIEVHLENRWIFHRSALLSEAMLR